MNNPISAITVRSSGSEKPRSCRLIVPTFRFVTRVLPAHRCVLPPAPLNRVRAAPFRRASDVPRSRRIRMDWLCRVFQRGWREVLRFGDDHDSVIEDRAVTNRNEPRWRGRAPAGDSGERAGGRSNPRVMPDQQGGAGPAPPAAWHLALVIVNGPHPLQQRPAPDRAA